MASRGPSSRAWGGPRLCWVLCLRRPCCLGPRALPRRRPPPVWLSAALAPASSAVLPTAAVGAAVASCCLPIRPLRPRRFRGRRRGPSPCPLGLGPHSRGPASQPRGLSVPPQSRGLSSRSRVPAPRSWGLGQWGQGLSPRRSGTRPLRRARGLSPARSLGLAPHSRAPSPRALGLSKAQSLAASPCSWGVSGPHSLTPSPRSLRVSVPHSPALSLLSRGTSAPHSPTLSPPSLGVSPPHSPALSPALSLLSLGSLGPHSPPPSPRCPGLSVPRSPTLSPRSWGGSGPRSGLGLSSRCPGLWGPCSGPGLSLCSRGLSPPSWVPSLGGLPPSPPGGSLSRPPAGTSAAARCSLELRRLASPESPAVGGDPGLGVAGALPGRGARGEPVVEGPLPPRLPPRLGRLPRGKKGSRSRSRCPPAWGPEMTGLNRDWPRPREGRGKRLGPRGPGEVAAGGGGAGGGPRPGYWGAAAPIRGSRNSGGAEAGGARGKSAREPRSARRDESSSGGWGQPRAGWPPQPATASPRSRGRQEQAPSRLHRGQGRGPRRLGPPPRLLLSSPGELPSSSSSSSSAHGAVPRSPSTSAGSPARVSPAPRPSGSQPLRRKLPDAEDWAGKGRAAGKRGEAQVSDTSWGTSDGAWEAWGAGTPGSRGSQSLGKRGSGGEPCSSRRM